MFHKKKAAKKPSLKVPKDSIEKLHQLGCAGCSLDKAPCHTPKMGPTLGGNDILFLAEAPGRHEDERSGKPLTGPSGLLLRSVLSDNNNYSFDNICNCRPPENRTPTGQEIACCHPRRVKVIEELKPKLIVGLGVVPLSAMLGSVDMAGMRGRFFAIKVGNHACWFMPTYHPSFILRIAYDKSRPLQSKFGHCFRMDIDRAVSWLDGCSSPNMYNERTVRDGIVWYAGNTGDFELLLSLFHAAKKAKVKAIDIETQGLRPYSKGAAILTCAISYDDVNFAFALDHPTFPWKGDQHLTIFTTLGDILKDDIIKIAYNVFFELE
jgi:uracil-DNA glycosylase family 4